LQRVENHDVRAKRADALFLNGKLAEAAQEFERLADGAGDPWRVRAAEAYIKLGDLDRGIALLDGVFVRRGHAPTRFSRRARSVARAIGVSMRLLLPLPGAQHDDVIASADRVIACFLSTPYPIESFEYVMRGITLAERTGDRAAHSMGMSMLAAYLAAGSLGRFGDRA